MAAHVTSEAPRPVGESRTLALAVVLAVFGGLAVAYVGRPYELGRTSTILVKNDMATAISAARKAGGRWPEALPSETPRTRLEEPPVKAQFLSSTVREEAGKPLPVEVATYRFWLRGRAEEVEVRFDPNQPARRRRA